MLRRFWNLFRVVAGTAGRAAFQRAAPLYFAILVAASIIFSPLGMNASDVTTLMARSSWFRVSLWALWLLATTPAARAVLCAPALFILRSLPVPRALFFAAQLILLVVVESPWIALHARGAGAGSGLCAGIAAMAAHTLIIARPRRVLELLSSGLLFLFIAHPFSQFLFLLLSLPLALFALYIGMVAAWVRAPERDVASGRPLVHGHALSALSLAYALTLWRSHGALLLRTLLLALLGTAIAALALRNNDIHSTELRCTVTLGALAAPLLLGACGLAGPVLRSERQAQWLLESCGVQGKGRVLSSALAVSLWTALCGALGALLVGWLLAGSPLLLLRLGLGAAIQCALVGVVASCCVRWAQRGDKKDGDRVLLIMLFLCFCIALLTWLLHEMVLGFWMVLAVLMLDRAIAATSPRGRWLRLRQERAQPGELP